MSKKGATKSGGRNKKARGEAGVANAGPTPDVRRAVPHAMASRFAAAIPVIPGMIAYMDRVRDK